MDVWESIFGGETQSGGSRFAYLLIMKCIKSILLA